MKKGFSLVELMVVIGIIGIILAIAIPSFSAMQQRARIRASAQEIAQDVRQFRERSLSTSLNYAVTFDVANREYTATWTQPDGAVRTKTYRLGQTTGGNIRFGCISGVSGNPPEGWLVAPAGDGIDFLPNDILNIDNRGGANRGVIYVTDNKESYAVGISTLGRVKVYKFDSGNWY